MGHFVSFYPVILSRYCICSPYCYYTCDLNILGTCIEASVSSSQNWVVTEVRPNIAPRGLSREWHLPFAILLHFLEFACNNNGLVDHVLKIGVVIVEQLELNIIVQSL
jgi:hypothetical protein